MGTVGFSSTAKEEPQVVVNFSDGSDGRPGVVGGGFLVDGDGGTETFDGLYIGFVQLSQELTRIGAEGFDIAPLTFGEDGIEGEGGLPGTGDACKDDELIAGEVDINLFQVMLTRPPNANDIFRVWGRVPWGRRLKGIGWM